MSAQAGKKGKKKGKGKTISLNDFLGDTQGPGIVKQIDWADEAEDEHRSVNSSLAYQSTSAPKILQLPTAPRAARTVEIDHSRIPENGPFTAFVGNLPYEVDQHVLQEFFKDLPIANVRLPEENGRFKGFGYVQFEDRQSLIKALEMNEETLQKRNIKIDIADNQSKDSGRGSYGRSGDRYGSQNSGPDPTEGNWRSKPPAEDRSSYRNDDDRYRKGSSDYDGPNKRYDRQGSYGNRGYEDRNRSYDDRNRGYDNRNRGYDDRNRGYDDRSHGYDDRNRGGYDDRSRGYDDRSRGYDDRSRGGYDDRSRGYDDRSRGYDDRSRGGYDDRSGGYDDRSRGYDRPRYGNRGYDRQRHDRPRDDEPPRERPQLRLQPRQKPLDDSAENVTRPSSIFGAAKPVDTSVKEKAIEEKLFVQQKSMEENRATEKRSASIFGEAKPIDTTAREREMEEKIAAEKERLISAAKQPPVSARASVFGDAKPVDTTAREKEMEEKLRKREEELLQTADKDDSDKRSRLSSHRSDDVGPTSPRRSRNSSVRSSEDQLENASTTSKTTEKKATGKPAAPQYRPAPPPKENAWGRKIFSAEKPASLAAAKPQNDSQQRNSKVDQRGEREEAEGSREEEEERIPEGAADEERAITSRNEPGDGSEERYSSSSRRDANRYRSDRPSDSYQNRNTKYGAGRQGSNQYRNRNYGDDSGYRENRRRGDGDSQSHRSGSGFSNSASSGRNRRDGGARTKSRNERNEKRRDSSRDSRPECDRVDGAGQEQPSTGGGRSGKSRPKPKQIEKEQPIEFVTQSKFALLSMDESDENVDND